MTSRANIALFLGAFIVGIFALPGLPLERVILACMACLGLGVLLSIPRRLRPAAIGISACCAGLLLASLRIAQLDDIMLDPQTTPTHIEGMINAPATGEAAGLRYQLKTPDGKAISVSTRSTWPRFAYGDHVEINGKWQTLDGGYRDYLRSQSVAGVMNADRITLLGQGDQNPVMTAVYAVRAVMEEQIGLLFPEPHAGLLIGLLTGARQHLSEATLNEFRRAGISHMLAVSGYNITLLLSLCFTLLFFLPLRWRLLPAGLIVVFFVLLTGASASVVRAAIMGILGLFALGLGRLGDVRIAILWTAAGMLLWNPLLLRFDAGFQLSFLSVLGITELSPLFMEYLKSWPKYLRESIALTMAAQFFAAPWGMLLFGDLSLVSPIANLVIAPLVPPAMLFGAIGTGVGALLPSAGTPFASVAWLLMEGMLKAASLLATPRYASVSLGIFTGVSICFYYAALLMGMTWARTMLRDK